MDRLLGRRQFVGRDGAGDDAPAVGVPALLELGGQELGCTVRRYPSHVPHLPGRGVLGCYLINR